VIKKNKHFVMCCLVCSSLQKQFPVTLYVVYRYMVHRVEITSHHNIQLHS